MSEQDTTYNYTPPAQVASNTDPTIQAYIQQQIAAALAQHQAEQAAASAPVVLSPEQEARKALDNAGAGLGVEERLAELYRHLELIARKVGL